MAMDIYRYDNLQELEVLARNCVATLLRQPRRRHKGRGSGGEEKHERGEKRGELSSLPNPFFFFPSSLSPPDAYYAGYRAESFFD